MQELPTTAGGITQWCKDVFVTKLSSSQGILVGLILLIIAVVMQILIQSSKAKRSTPVEALQKEAARERLLHE
ncbi:hypothetical protein SAY86_020148 [Trapa natans]|uniref:Uncharacterized protein n=1 Tax=Trapa natans TaxID=22666 RepID=A0AAN7LPB7_TRANT|nr:hypothetical protein SAY86_020148 [Trapa natans]